MGGAQFSRRIACCVPERSIAWELCHQTKKPAGGPTGGFQHYNGMSAMRFFSDVVVMQSLLDACDI